MIIKTLKSEILPLEEKDFLFENRRFIVFQLLYIWLELRINLAEPYFSPNITELHRT